MSLSEMTKKSLKYIEIPLNNFTEVAVPYHVNLLEEHKNASQQVKDDPNKIRNQEIVIKRTETQLKNLLYELETLRAQVYDEELDKFDVKTVALRKTILQIITEYKEITKQLKTLQIREQKPESHDENERIRQEPAQLTIAGNIQEMKLQERESCLRSVERIQTDIQDLHSAYGHLNQMVNEQGEMVDNVEGSVEDAQDNIHVAVRHLAVASRLKASLYPVAGAVVGGALAGPIGLLAGLKAGGIAALSFGCLGYVGGRVLNKHSCLRPHELNAIENDLYQQSNQAVHTEENKKDE